MDLDMPQLRQLVLKNTERIDKNELMIKQMRKEGMEQARKSAERDEWLENSRREHDRWARSMRETLDEIAQYSKQSQIEQEMRSLELDARFAETDRQLKETDRQLKETDRQLKETDRQLKETSLEVKRLSRQLSGTTGHIVEGLVSSSTEKIFEKEGLFLHNSGKNLKRSLPSENIAMEVDVLLSNEELAIPIEVKANCTKDNVRRFLHQMSHFRRLFPEYDGKEVVAAIAAIRRLFPEYDGKEVVAAIAAINYEKGVAELAHREKLLVIRVNSDDIFSIDPFQKDELRKF